MFRKIYITGIAVYIILLWLSLGFYKERVLFLDHAYYLFELITKQRFAIFHYRSISIVTQVLPWLAIQLSLPLKQVMLAYSANIVLFYLCCYLTCGWLKDYKAAMGLLLFHLLFATHTFYFALSEMIQATALLFPLLALIRRYTHTPGSQLPSVFILALLPVIAFAHPLMIFPVGFLLAFLWLAREERISTRAALWMGGAYAAILVLKAIFFKEPYEAGAMGNLKNFFTLFPNYFNLHSNKVFLYNCLTEYYWIPIGSALIIAVYTRSKQWWKLALFAAAMLGYLLLINVSYNSDREHEFYMENLYMPLAFFLALPLAYDVLPPLAQSKRVVAYTLLAAISITGLVRIYAAHEPYTARVNWLRQYAVDNEGMKIIADQRHAPMDTLFLSWATPYEFWAASTLQRNRTASILFTDTIEELIWAAGQNHHFITRWGAYSYDSLDKRYFKFADSSSGYKLLP